MPRLDEVELVVTNNITRTRARMNNSQYNDLGEFSSGTNRGEPTVELVREEATEDDHLLSPRKARQG